MRYRTILVLVLPLLYLCRTVVLSLPPETSTAAETTGPSDWLPRGVEVSGVVVSGTSASNTDLDDLMCDYVLGGGATTAGTAWYVNGVPQMALFMPMEGDSAAFNDYSGNGVTAAPVGNPVWNPNQGVDGSGIFLFFGSSALDAGESFPAHSSYTKTAWVIRSAGGTGNAIVAGDAGGGGHRLSAAATDGYRLSAGHNGNWTAVQDSTPLAPGYGYFVAVTYDDETGEMILYKNGMAVDSETLPPADQVVVDSTLTIGSAGAGNFWIGKIDEVRIYDHALSPQQINSLLVNGGDVIKSSETTAGDAWYARVTPFSHEEAGPTTASNTLTVQSSAPPPGVALVLVSGSITGGTDSLLCTYDLKATGVTAGVAWFHNGAPHAALYMPMEGNRSNALKDFSGNGFSSGTTRNPQWSATAGHDGHGAFVFDGSNFITAGEAMPTMSSYTKAAWVYRKGPGSDDANNILSGDSNAMGHALWAPDNNGNRLAAGHNENWTIVEDTQPLALDTWYFVAVTYDYDTHDMVLYRDGIVVDSADVPLADRDVTDATVRIGAFTTGFTWEGTIDDARIYDHVLSPIEIGSLYTNGADVLKPDLVLGDVWWTEVTPFSTSGAGTTMQSNILTIQDMPSGIDDSLVRDRHALYPNRPNPFNPATVIRYDVRGAGGNVALRIYDVAGREVRTLVDGHRSGGRHSAVWDGTDAGGQQVASGVYFYRLTAPGYARTLKMTLIK